MPTAEEFDRLALRFDELAGRSGRLLDLVRAGADGVVVGGVLGPAVAATLDAGERTGRVAAAGWADLAATCRSRAAVVRAYTAELAQWEVDVRRHRQARAAWDEAAALAADDPTAPSPGPPPRAPERPSAPAGWVEA